MDAVEETPFHTACRQNDIETVRALIANYDGNFQASVNLAIRLNHIEIATLILRHWRKDITPGQLFTVCFQAVISGRPSIVEWVARYGFDQWNLESRDIGMITSSSLLFQLWNRENSWDTKLEMATLLRAVGAKTDPRSNPYILIRKDRNPVPRREEILDWMAIPLPESTILSIRYRVYFEFGLLDRLLDFI